jgi:hypothetical protein
MFHHRERIPSFVTASETVGFEVSALTGLLVRQGLLCEATDCVDGEDESPAVERDQHHTVNRARLKPLPGPIDFPTNVALKILNRKILVESP